MSHGLRSLPKRERWRNKPLSFDRSPSARRPTKGPHGGGHRRPDGEFPEAVEGFTADGETRTPEWNAQ